MTITDSSTATGPMRLLPKQRSSRARARHLDPISGHEAAAEIPEDWSMPCAARRCSKACVAYRGPGWRAFEVRS